MIELNKSYPTAYFSLGVAYFRKGMLNEAMDAIEAGLKLNPDELNALTNLGAIYEQAGHLKRAVEILQFVIRKDGRHGRAFFNLGVAFEKLGMHKEAAKAYEDAAGLNYRRDYAIGRSKYLKELNFNAG